MFLKEFANIGKKVLTQSVGLQKNYKEVITYEYIDNSKCEGCIINEAIKLNSATDTMEHYCRFNCRKNIVKKEKVIYNNEKNRLRISDNDPYIPSNIRLSRLQLLQFILYHFAGPDNNGIVKNISTHDVAEILNCTTKSVENNNKRLADLGYIYYCSSLDKNTYNVYLTHYKEYHLSRSENGTGYIVMPKNIMEQLVSIESVNALRLAIRQLLSHDNNNIYVNRRIETKQTYNKLKRFLPNYINYKRLINMEIEQNKHIFEIKKQDDQISYILKKEFDGKVQKRSREEYLFNYYLDRHSEDKYTLNDIGDLVDLALIYGKDIVDQSIDIVYEEYFLTGQDIQSFGALVNTYIKVILDSKLA